MQECEAARLQTNFHSIVVIIRSSLRGGLFFHRLIVRLSDWQFVRLSDRQIVRLPICEIVRLSICQIARLPDCQIVILSDRHLGWKSFEQTKLVGGKAGKTSNLPEIKMNILRNLLCEDDRRLI